MAAGTYKSGVAIIVVYQAVACATGKTVTMDVYDEAHAKDEAKCVAAMTEVAATGRYYATFTPDAEGEWITVMKNTTDSNGEVVKAFAVAGHDLDSVGDTVAAIDTLIKAAGDGDLAAMKVILDAESGVKAAVVALNDFDPATDAVATVTALTGHTAQTGDGYAVVSHVTYGLSAIKTLIDAIPTTAMRGTDNAATEAKQDIIDTVVDGIQTDLDNATDGLGALKTAIDAVSAPAMVG